MSLDLVRVRADFPALEAGLAYFDSPGGTQTPAPVAEAVRTAMSGPLSNRGTANLAARNADTIVVEARRAVADLTGADPRGVVFGRSATQLTVDFARTLVRDWAAGDELVVTRLDHDANIRPWVLAAQDRGVTVRWVDFDPASGELDPAAVAAVLTERTRLVALTAASNLIGTRPDVRAVADAAHAVGALVWVDGVHYAAHALVDVGALGCDVFVCSPYKFFGPHHGALVADPALLEGLHPAKLLPSSDAVPERFELGTLPYEQLVGTTAAIDHLAGLLPGTGTRRERLAASIAAAEEHEARLQARIEQGLAELDATLYSRAAHRTSTLLFDLPGLEAAHVADRLAGVGVNAPAGHFYAIEASRHLGLGDRGAVRVGLAPYNDDADVDRLLAGLGAL
ncbi:cysteine desulfurase family protein, VC1184 subfamily [Friedmanniella luteola]|uniref:Cysteine desulfurase family protein, VC1184 subfamily n=1 Tax=Friedmanniella luteola TaxID=546871 RepID=A0A1H1R8U5_9ACTN|nr:cysteine desulfurase-like protein [Friedmanniella luteola]SDS32224.1 cysteine desulfurase family protein, VC1184 subfamily [Friedmanniella luteola]